MFLESKLPDTVLAPEPPRERRELHVYADRAKKVLRFEPRGVLETGCADEILGALGFPLTGGARDIVLAAVAICARWGWRPVDQWLDEANDLHVKIAKEER